MKAPNEAARLVERFRENREAFLSSEYNETQLRREFLDPFFKALGWDVDNEHGYAEAYKDVIHEDAIKVGGATKAPDYAFRIGGMRKFFVEAKRPSVGIKINPEAAYQLRRYAWSAKLPLSILTDFEEFAVYDCRVRPNKDDKASTARAFYFTFDQYEAEWDEIAGIFARDAILKGSFDKYVEARKKRGTAEVDDAFLKEIEGWRDALARNIAIRNTGLSNREVNFAVQRTIDRIIFLRICEDRGIEAYGQLMTLRNGSDVYRRLCEVFRNADGRYNSGLFHFRKEKERVGAPDEITLGLEISDKVLKDVFKDLYYPDSPYEFSVLPADILGHIYEQFLGKVIRLTPAHRAVVEEKPEVRKAGGVYYTPTYIVDYIIEHAVGELLEGKTPNQVTKLRVLDPACGSGSFLLGAYQRLLSWHLAWYAENEPEKHARGRQPKVFLGLGGDWRLTTAEKKRILLNCIYGVDIDPQAVEVTKLSLLLKVLEGESEETLGKTLRMFHERALPDLGENIKCGNSLIGPDFYEGKQLSLIAEEERYRINAFDWNAEFPVITEAGGFDAVIGNPPYLFAGMVYPEYFARNYSLMQYQSDYYVVFVERSLRVARRGAKVAMIVSDSWLNSEYFSKLREHLLSENRLERIAVFRNTVFRNVALENSILVAVAGGSPSAIVVDRFESPGDCRQINELDSREALRQGLIDPMFSEPVRKITAKLEEGSTTLQRLVRINRGLHAYRTDGYGKSKFGDGPMTEEDKKLQSYHSDVPLDETYLPELRGKHVARYTHTSSGKYLSYGPWLAESRSPEFFLGPKVALRKVLGSRLSGTFIEGPAALDQSLYILVPMEGDPAEVKHALGILLSGIGSWYLRNRFSIRDKVFPWYTKRQLAGFPIKHDDNSIAALVDQMLLLHATLSGARTPDERSRLNRQIDATDKQIDQLVYELYGLTDKEIRIVEEATR